MESAGPGWAQLRQQTRSAETQTENLFRTYNQFSSTTSISAKPSDEETRIEQQIRELLDKREELIKQLANLLDSESALTSSALKQNNLSRHREVLQEHRTQLQRIKSGITATRERMNLLSNVRNDIDQYRSSNPAQEEADYMLQERGRIDSSNRMADGVLSQAYAINDQFNSQRETLASINRRIVGAASQLPGMNTLMNRIGSKKKRDSIILAVTIAFCVVMLFYFF